MKTKIIFLFSIFCATVSYFTVSVNNAARISYSVTLASLMTLAYAENDPDGGENSGNDVCMTDFDVTYLMQDCQGARIMGRVAFVYKCKGDNPGYCEEGVEYIYYDCDGVIIKEDSRVNEKSCK